MRKIIFCFSFLVALQVLQSQPFRFNQQKGQEYRIVSEVTEGVFFNDQLIGESIILNRIAVAVVDADDSGALLDVRFGISEQSLNTGLYIFSREEQSRYRREHSGRYGDIPPDESLPSVRHIPTFPDGPVSVGDSWSATAEEVHDLLPFFRVDYRFHIPFRVFYTYAGTDLYQGRTVDVIHINYHYMQDLEVLSLPPGTLPGGGADLPQGVSGDFKVVYLWDRAAGIPAAVTEEFTITYVMSSGDRYIFRGFSEGEVIQADQWNKEDIREMIEGVLRDEELEDVSVTVNDDGIMLTLEDIHFFPDTADLLPGEEAKLEELGRILNGLPGHDLLITGHTAFVPGLSGDSLSEERASAVAGFFLGKGIRNSSEMIIKGMGSSRPIADNNSEEGRKKNRRVEITILDN